jgi:sugar fermentation stimulation protein A
MKELAQAVSEGFRAVALFVIQRIDVSSFTPNRDMDPGFSDALVGALEAGVEVWPWRCKVSLEGIALDASLPVRV